VERAAEAVAARSVAAINGGSVRAAGRGRGRGRGGGEVRRRIEDGVEEVDGRGEPGRWDGGAGSGAAARGRRGGGGGRRKEMAPTGGPHLSVAVRERGR
jgi:hypothetical protein